MMEVIKSGAGKKALEKGITFVTAAVKTSARELGKMGSTVVEEVLTSFTSWFIEEFTMHFASGG